MSMVCQRCHVRNSVIGFVRREKCMHLRTSPKKGIGILLLLVSEPGETHTTSRWEKHVHRFSYKHHLYVKAPVAIVYDAAKFISWEPRQSRKKHVSRSCARATLYYCESYFCCWGKEGLPDCRKSVSGKSKSTDDTAAHSPRPPSRISFIIPLSDSRLSSFPVEYEYSSCAGGVPPIVW